jgi:hypothetical protein
MRFWESGEYGALFISLAPNKASRQYPSEIEHYQREEQLLVSRSDLSDTPICQKL